MRVLLCLTMAAGLLPAADPLADRFQRASASLAAGDYAAAETGFQQVLKASPNHVGALGNLGVVYSRSERTDQAIEVYRRALRLAPNDKGLLLNLGLAFLKVDAHADALFLFQRLLGLDPRHLQTRELAATCKVYTGQANEAAAELDTLRREDPTNHGLLYLLGVAWLKGKQSEKARAALDEFLASAPPPRAALVLCKAYYDSGRFDDAAAHCRRTLVLDPDFAGAHRELGKVLVSQRSPDAAKELRAALRQNPNDAEALYFLGGVLLQDNDLAAAVPCLERALRLNSGFWGNYFYLGKAKAQSGQLAAAVPLLRRAAELNSGESAIFYQLGRAFTAAGQPEEAKRAMDRVRELKAAELRHAAEAVQK